MNRRVGLLISGEIVVEGLTAVALVLFPREMARLLLGAVPPDIGVLSICIVGVALGLFVFGCWLGQRHGASRAVLLALLAYNLLAIGVFAWFGVSSDIVGILLWPAVAAHAVVTTMLAAVLFRRWPDQDGSAGASRRSPR